MGSKDKATPIFGNIKPATDVKIGLKENRDSFLSDIGNVGLRPQGEERRSTI